MQVDFAERTAIRVCRAARAALTAVGRAARGVPRAGRELRACASDRAGGRHGRAPGRTRAAPHRPPHAQDVVSLTTAGQDVLTVDLCQHNEAVCTARAADPPAARARILSARPRPRQPRQRQGQPHPRTERARSQHAQPAVGQTAARLTGQRSVRGCGVWPARLNKHFCPMSALLRDFEELSLPSRSARPPARLCNADLEAIFASVRAGRDSERKTRQYRKLRELATLSRCSDALAARIGAASAECALTTGDLAEFVAAASRLVAGRSCAACDERGWLASMLLLHYACVPHAAQDTAALFRAAPMRTRQSTAMLATVPALVAIAQGNVFAFARAAAELRVPARFHEVHCQCPATSAGSTSGVSWALVSAQRAAPRTAARRSRTSPPCCASRRPRRRGYYWQDKGKQFCKGCGRIGRRPSCSARSS